MGESRTLLTCLMLNSDVQVNQAMKQQNSGVKCITAVKKLTKQLLVVLAAASRGQVLTLPSGTGRKMDVHWWCKQQNELLCCWCTNISSNKEPKQPWFREKRFLLLTLELYGAGYWSAIETTVVNLSKTTDNKLSGSQIALTHNISYRWNYLGKMKAALQSNDQKIVFVNFSLLSMELSFNNRVFVCSVRDSGQK